MSAAAAAYSRLLENFMSPDFDVAEFVREMVANAESKGSATPRRRSQSAGGGAVGVGTAVIAQLDQAIFTVDEQLRSKVADCYDQLLLNDTTDLDRVDGELRQVRESVAVLRATLDNVQTEALAPFKVIKRRLDTLERAQKAAALVRSTQKLLLGVRKLRMQMQAANAESASAFDGRPSLGPHSAKAAILAYGLQMCRTSVGGPRQLTVGFCSQALMVGLKPDFGSPVKQRAVLMSAVQVLFELGCLPTEGRACAAAVVSNVDAFALQVPEENSAQGDIVNLEQFWRVAEKLGEAIVLFGRPVEMLDELVRLGVDPLTQKPFMSSFQEAEAEPISRAAWEAVADGLAVKRLKHAHTTNRNLRAGKASHLSVLSSIQ
ncbi:hypothetical protein Pmar_PMAR019669 [Perkinsus marinus ATCC 50983]|uniref:Conserved oligomeric Golgi complex subunit 5 N-terminal domain-containing protein n=1 Tax=Perkinsus marinus (strain ATCC 50983 / TXsc) TaxID=423536 RepID=C5LF51_PERM5|nr:hypothetical protein Pmar_PMAR019669 [Perkinsus marinus ATCC 50983]EER04635.1 hypothetical protein Pmar_PMAR019669 [Perkinsus marinus ATCC 50983]|eukprot:XP_002772819.1 hypothetical protein Pmar_PMAR019669 [Perkinsus marinus ATCC 50983]